MRFRAAKIVGIACAKLAHVVANGNLQLAFQNDSALLALMNQRMPTGRCSGLIALVQQLDRASSEVSPDLSVGHTAVAYFGQLSR
jgi:hypothetical protein